MTSALIHCARAADDPIQVLTPQLGGVADVQTACDGDLMLRGDIVTVTADRPEVNIWTWPKG